MGILRLAKIETTDEFRALAAAVQAPLPWEEHPFVPGLISTRTASRS